jgi:hypothetical protein
MRRAGLPNSFLPAFDIVFLPYASVYPVIKSSSMRQSTFALTCAGTAF